MATTDIIIHEKKDNVGVVVIEKIIPNQDCNCWVMENDSSVQIHSKNEIPYQIQNQTSNSKIKNRKPKLNVFVSRVLHWTSACISFL